MTTLLGLAPCCKTGGFNASYWLSGWALLALAIAAVLLAWLSVVVGRWFRLVRHIRRYGSARAPGPRRYHFDEHDRMTEEPGERWE